MCGTMDDNVKGDGNTKEYWMLTALKAIQLLDELLDGTSYIQYDEKHGHRYCTYCFKADKNVDYFLMRNHAKDCPIRKAGNWLVSSSGVKVDGVCNELSNKMQTMSRDG